MSALSRDKRAVSEVNTVHGGVSVNHPAGNIGNAYHLREAMYREHELKGTNIQTPTMRTLSWFSACLSERKALYVSVTDLMGQRHLSPSIMQRNTIASVLNELAGKGILHRAARVAWRGQRNVVVYGLTGKGKQMLALYFAYLSGEYDHLLPAGLGA